MRWNDETVALEAKKYTERKKFNVGSKGAYLYAHRKGLLNTICSHMVDNKNAIWTNETVALEAKKYTTKTAFDKGSRGAYNYAMKHNIIKDVCSHMVKHGLSKWSYESCAKVASAYKTKTTFRKGNSGAYAYAHRSNIVNDICSHMEDVLVEWDNDNVLSCAMKCTTRSEFAQKYSGAVKYARRNEIMDDVCSHMEDSKYWSDNDVIYVWNIPNTNIYKIGVTSEKLGDSRIKYVAKVMGVDYKIISMKKVERATTIETELHNTYTILSTTLPKRDGHTEFRVLTQSDVNEIADYLENWVD